MELLSKLGIDWKLLIAQIVNFTILLGVLGYFVYTPLLNLIDARRERIRKSMEDAKRIEDQKKELDLIRVEQLKKIDQEAGVLLEKAKQQAEKMKGEILAGAKKEADLALDRGRKQLEEERAAVTRDLQGSLGRVILTLTEKILEREWSDADQKRLLESIEKQIPTLVR